MYLDIWNCVGLCAPCAVGPGSEAVIHLGNTVVSVDILQIQGTIVWRLFARIRPEVVASGTKAPLVTGWRSQDVYILMKDLGVRYFRSVDEPHGGYA